MHSEQPFKLRNAKIDAQGNVVIVRLHASMEPVPSEVEGLSTSAVEEPLNKTNTVMPSAPNLPRAESRGARGVSRQEPCLILHIPFVEPPEAKAIPGTASPFRTKKIRLVSARPRLDGSAKFPFLHSARARLHAYEKASPRMRFVLSSGRFLGNFTVVFLFLFISLNVSSFWEVTKARLLPDIGSSERRALEIMTTPLSREQLLSIPELPMAGLDAGRNAAAALNVTPPDNRLVIPEIGKNVPIVEASDAAVRREDWKTFEKDVQDALHYGVVHYPGTATPGDPGNVFLTGHSAYLPWDWGKYKEVFALLSKLTPGDEYSVYYRGDLHRYRVTKKFEVSPKDVSVLEQPDDKYLSTLMTCTPIGTTLRRLVVQAEEINPRTGKILKVAKATPLRPSGPAGQAKWTGELAI